MKKPITPKNEKERRNSLDSYQLIGLREQENFDFLTSMASLICETKISLISLITEDKQWFLSHHGIEARETFRDYAFCAHAINTPDDPFIIEDATKDIRFYDNPLTTGEPNVIFYAGIPLVSIDGYPLGTLCVIDDAPKKLSSNQIEQLKKLAKLCTELFEKRKEELTKNALIAELNETNELLEETQKVNKLGIWELDIKSGKTKWNDMVYAIHEVATNFEHDRVNGIEFYHEDYRKIISEAIGKCISKSIPFDLECILLTGKKNEKWVRATGRKVGGKLIGSFQDISRQKEVERKIRESKEQYQSLVQNIPGITYRCKYDKDWTMLYMSSEVDSVSGYAAEELLNNEKTSYGKLIHEDDRIMVERVVNTAVENNEFWEIEYRLKHKSGAIRWVYEKGTAIKNDKGETVFLDGFVLDITDRKNAQIEAKYQRQLLDSLYKLSPIGIALNDYETGAFIDVNDKLLEPTGYSKQEFLALSYWDVTPKEYELLEVNALNQMKAHGGYQTFEKEYIRKDGSRYPISLQGVVVTDTNGEKLIWSFIRDITEEKAAERKLNEAISNLQGVLDASKQVSIIATDKNGLITLFNSGAEQILGYKAMELIGKYTPEVIHLQEEVEKESAVLSNKYQKQIIGFETFIYEAKIDNPSTKEWTYVNKRGDHIPVLLSVNKIEVDNEIIGYLGVAADISELKKIQGEIKSLLDITEEQNNSLRNFAHIVSHNLRSHSYGISGLLEVFQEDYPDLKKGELFPLLKRSADNLNQTIEDLTEIVKVNLTDMKINDIDLSQFVEKNLNSMTIQIKDAGIEIINECNSCLNVKGIPAYIDSIILNMISNAIKYKSPKRKPILKIYSETNGEKVFLTFQDNGLGIDLEKHGENLFQMYKTFHNHEDARGVGLFITKNQIESMNGKIHVDSKVDEGTAFKIEFHKSDYE